jgi:nicotinamidase-related amidase
VSGLLERGRSRLLVVDVQEKLAPAMADYASMEAAAGRLIQGARRLAVPAVVSEQYPAGLGPTVAALREALGAETPVLAKTAFSCLGDAALKSGLLSGARDQVVVCGLEAHVCVLQTSLDLLAHGREVYVVADAVASRVQANRALALERLARARAQIVSTEMVLFEWLGDAADPAFKDISRLVR